MIFFLYLQGVGDSAQGFVNALLFCVFTPKVREKFKLSGICKACQSPKQRASVADLQLSNSSSLPTMKGRNRTQSPCNLVSEVEGSK